MPKKRMWPVVIAVAVCVCAIYASHTYAQHLAYKTGVYMGKASFTTEDYKNRQCFRLRAASVPYGCEVQDLGNDSVMENALASAYIIPTMSESDVAAIHVGFRDGWREARTTGFANR
jgi:hypothetical protein